ncbi:MAG: MFS transporter, partial [Pseudomonadota bacterium]
MLSLIRNEWQLLLFGFLMTFWSSPGQTFLISLFSGELRAELGFSDGEFAAIYSAATLLSAIVMVWSGALADRIDLKKLSIFTVVGLAIGCGMMSLVAGAISLFISLFLLRQLGQGLMYLISSTAMVRYIDAHKGKANAIASMGYTVAEAVMPGLLVLLLLWVGWRHSWQIAGLVVLIVMVPADYLENRRQYVEVNGVRSAQRSCSRGVP